MSTISTFSTASSFNPHITNCFTVGQKYDFEIISEEFDAKAGKSFFTLRDKIVGATHRYYHAGNHPASPGENISLQYKELTKQGRLFLVEPVAPISKEELSKLSMAEDYRGVLENDTLEFKSSAVFTGNGEKNIDHQFAIEISQQVCALANHKGGTVVIGVANDGSVKGINADLQELNTSAYDKFKYPQNLDGFEQKCRNVINWGLGPKANLLTQVRFAKDINDKVICLLEVTPSDTALFFRGNSLFVRNGNTTKLLKGEDMTRFIISKETASLTNNHVNTSSKKPLTAVKHTGIQRYLSFYNNGMISMQKGKSNDSDILFNVPLTAADCRNQKARLILCYDDGRIAAFNPSDIIKSKLKNEGQKYLNGYCRTYSKLVKVLVCEKADSLLIDGQMNGMAVRRELPVEDLKVRSSLHTPGIKYANGMQIKKFSLK